MGKRLRWVVAIVAVSAVGIGGFHLRQREQADALMQRAAKLLLAPVEEVGDIERLQGPLAVQLLEQAAGFHDSDRTRVLRHTARGIELLQQHDYLAAEGELFAAHQIDPRDLNVRVVLASVFIAAGRPDEAQPHLDAVLAQEPDHARGLIVASDLAMERRQFDAATALIDRVIAAHPKAGVAFNRRGLIHEARNDDNAALDDYEHASEVDVHLAAPHINRGRLLRDHGRCGEADRAFSAALERNETDSAAWMGRGLCRLQVGRVRDAETDLIRARDLSPGTRDPLVALSELYAGTGDTDQAIELLRAAIQIDANDALSWLKLGNSLMRTRQLQEAATAYRKSASLAPQLAAAHNGLGAALSLLGDHQGAMAQLARAAELDTGDPNPLLNLARLNERMGDHRAAVEAWRAALDRDPSAPVPVSVRRSAGT